MGIHGRGVEQMASMRSSRPMAKGLWCAALVLAICILSAEAVRFQISFEALWRDGGIPNNRFLRLAGMSHSSGVNMWRDGQLASSAMSDLILRDNTAPIINSFNQDIRLGQAQNAFQWNSDLSSPGLRLLEFEASDAFPFLSLAAGVSPSPDWFVGLDTFNLKQNGVWVTNLPIQMYLYDLGTQNGESFAAATSSTVPQQPISRRTADQSVYAFLTISQIFPEPAEFSPATPIPAIVDYAPIVIERPDKISEPSFAPQVPYVEVSTVPLPDYQVPPKPSQAFAGIDSLPPVPVQTETSVPLPPYVLAPDASLPFAGIDSLPPVPRVTETSVPLAPYVLAPDASLPFAGIDSLPPVPVQTETSVPLPPYVFAPKASLPFAGIDSLPPVPVQTETSVPLPPYVLPPKQSFQFAGIDSLPPVPRLTETSLSLPPYVVPPKQSFQFAGIDSLPPVPVQTETSISLPPYVIPPKASVAFAGIDSLPPVPRLTETSLSLPPYVFAPKASLPFAGIDSLPPVPAATETSVSLPPYVFAPKVSLPFEGFRPLPSVSIGVSSSRTTLAPLPITLAPSLPFGGFKPLPSIQPYSTTSELVPFGAK